ncbi:hypothetical protein QBC40DRAFT_108241 [Triangularia verruculosa]|uniref:Uncharacterized protein n=1 Tax=Triangularia verruculosa TaxID=2587418 RepID=A0AAN6XAU3_9PEZI|nr:hypothetical protein QBC40DRAFT_108241 [Triangularia verruculosa]
MSMPSSPAGGGTATTTPLQPMSHNPQRERESTLFSPTQSRGRGLTLGASVNDVRDSSVHEKINQFNSLAVQSKHLERKTADAALKRAMLGREEAEGEMRRYRDECRMLRRAVEEGRERERKVGERLETVMESYGRAKETHEHTKELWEKEIRRARKETFKTQSAFVKLQEELKSSRIAHKSTEEELHREKQLCSERAQEAFTLKYQLVTLQGQLDQALEKNKSLEQERDSFKTMAEQEKHLRLIAEESKRPASAEERITPRKRPRTSSISSSSSDVPDFEEITRQWQWEKQRADRAVQQVQFLETECRLRVCAAAKAFRRSSSSRGSTSSRRSSPRRKRPSLLRLADAADAMIIGESAQVSPEMPSPKHSKTDMLKEEMGSRNDRFFTPVEQPVRYSRTPSLDPPDFAVLEKDRTSLLSLLDAPHREESPALTFSIPTVPAPAPATVRQVQQEQEAQRQASEPESDVEVHRSVPHPVPEPVVPVHQEPSPRSVAPSTDPLPSTKTLSNDLPPVAPRPHTSNSFHRFQQAAAKAALTVVTTTTKVPLKDENKDPNLASKIMKMQKEQQQYQTPARGNGSAGGSENEWDKPSFDVNNPALTPTMTREEALAQIRDRRVRARSVGRPGTAAAAAGAQQGGSLSRKVSTETIRSQPAGPRGREQDRRDISVQSAPTVLQGRENRERSRPAGSGARRVRS